MPLTAHPPIRLIVGLGNPGREYERTRHNVGFMVLDALAGKWRFGYSGHPKWKSLTARHASLYFLKPQTYMNVSGEAVAACAQFYKVEPAEVLVIYDDVSLPLGKLRLRSTGSAGGHNGIKSILQHLGTDAFPRIKIGIGGAGQKSLSGHVLGKFTPEEQETLDKSLERAVEAVTLATLRGWEAAMLFGNTEVKPPPPPTLSKHPPIPPKTHET